MSPCNDHRTKARRERRRDREEKLLEKKWFAELAEKLPGGSIDVASVLPEDDAAIKEGESPGEKIEKNNTRRKRLLRIREKNVA